MSHILSSHILSPLGRNTAENFQAVLEGRSRLQRREGLWGMPQPVCVSIFEEAERAELCCEGLSWFESLVYRSAKAAMEEARLANEGLDFSGDDVLFVLASTKANVGDLGEVQGDYAHPAEAAERVAKRLGITTQPIVACNACISGLSAIILAHRLLESGAYKYAVVCGADVQSKFIVSGFQSLGALSPEACRPFDAERLGLNLGECAATLVLAAEPSVNSLGTIHKGLIRNDAYHLSAPSKKGDGQFLALSELSESFAAEDLAFVNAHGTATFFNDQMEAVALRRAGLTDVPVNALKGYYGHTMGAAGVLETILSFAALQKGVVLGTRGFEELGVSADLKLSNAHDTTAKTSFLKLLSGFGGGNAALLCGKAEEPAKEKKTKALPELRVAHSVKITPEWVEIDGKRFCAAPSEGDFLLHLYKTHLGDYPKFHKMDALSRLAFVAAELLLQAEGEARPEDTEGRGIILFNRTSTIHTDKKYLATTAPDNYFPSPSLFVYTLPNIATGEIAIRNAYHGETSFYILPSHDESLMRKVLQASCAADAMESLIAGWVDYEDEAHYEAELKLLTQ